MDVALHIEPSPNAGMEAIMGFTSASGLIRLTARVAFQ